jgi:hypothetical protein
MDEFGRHCKEAIEAVIRKTGHTCARVSPVSKLSLISRAKASIDVIDDRCRTALGASATACGRASVALQTNRCVLTGTQLVMQNKADDAATGACGSISPTNHST